MLSLSLCVCVCLSVCLSACSSYTEYDATRRWFALRTCLLSDSCKHRNSCADAIARPQHITRIADHGSCVPAFTASSIIPPHRCLVPIFCRSSGNSLTSIAAHVTFGGAQAERNKKKSAASNSTFADSSSNTFACGRCHIRDVPNLVSSQHMHKQ